MLELTRAVVLGAGLLLALPGTRLRAQEVPPAQQQQIESAIRALHAELRSAAQRLDPDAIYAHVLDTGTPPIIESGRLQPTRAAALASTATGFQGVSAISYAYQREHVTVLSPTIALWVAEGTATATLTDGRELTVPFAESIVLVRRDTRWQVLHAHRSAPPQR